MLHGNNLLYAYTEAPLALLRANSTAIAYFLCITCLGLSFTLFEGL